MKYCPECQAEFMDWVEKCSDCEVALVDELPAEEPKEDEGSKEAVELVTVFKTFNPTDIAFIKSVFDGSNIRYHIQGDSSVYGRPMVTPAAILVEKTQYDEAREIIRNFDFE